MSLRSPFFSVFSFAFVFFLHHGFVGFESIFCQSVSLLLLGGFLIVGGVEFL